MELILTEYGWLDKITGIEYATENEYYEMKGESSNEQC